MKSLQLHIKIRIGTWGGGVLSAFEIEETESIILPSVGVFHILNLPLIGYRKGLLWPEHCCAYQTPLHYISW
jgi:hypothetical protein